MTIYNKYRSFDDLRQAVNLHVNDSKKYLDATECLMLMHCIDNAIPDTVDRYNSNDLVHCELHKLFFHEIMRGMVRNYVDKLKLLYHDDDTKELLEEILECIDSIEKYCDEFG